jgi:single-stranded-DNA-specific exonuclease
MQVLYNRGLRSAEEVTAFLRGEDAVQENPYRLPDMARAVTRLLRAIAEEETICVYGDFDADGVSATALMTTALQAAGAKAGAYIPDRVDEGYGLNREAIAHIAEKAQVMVTVDCGMRSVDEVAYAQSLGMDVIVTDHHSIGPVLPPAIAVINPRRRDGPSTFDQLAGAGVAYRLAQAVLRAAAQHDRYRVAPADVEAIEQSLLDYVAIGTVADMMPLLGENRSLVRRGLQQLNRTERPGLLALMHQADLRPGTVNATAIAFRLGPRINAAGRLAHANLAYRLLRTDDPSEAYTLTVELEALNQQRRSLTEDAEDLAAEQVEPQLAQSAPLLLVRSPEIVSGVVGLVAGRLVERYYRPAVVVEEGDEECRGSARSVEEFDISRALDELSHLLVRHGGHSRAAGFTVETANLSTFERELRAIAERELSDLGELRPTLYVDAAVSLDEINWGVLEQFARLEPTGHDNPAPLLLSRGVRVREARAVGGGKHLKLIVDNGPSSPVLDAIAFREGEWARMLAEGSLIDIVYELQANEWQGRQRLQLNVTDIRIAA